MATVRFRFVATILLGSFLLFLVQPMVARMALPRLGGAPAVWNSAMLVYQALLLAGYAYAHWLGGLSPARQPWIHLALFALAGLTLPIGLIGATPPPDANPFLWVPWLLLVSIGPLFFVVSAQAPLIQRWYAMAGQGDPYPLYAASNFGSFAGLLCYPFLVEPLLAVGDQRWLWSAGYGLLAALVAWSAWALPRRAQPVPSPTDAAAPGWRERAYWILVAAVPSGLILSTTLHLTTDVGAMPLLWVLPLGLYLLSFTVAFSTRRGPARAIARVAPVILLFAAIGLFAESRTMALVFGIFALLNLFAVSVALHAQLFERRPDPSHLTLFYLMLSVGGVLGGIFCALVAPLLFNWTYEHLILLVAAAALMTGPSPFDRWVALWDGDSLARRLTWGGIALVALLAALGEGLFGFPESDRNVTALTVAILAVAIVAIGNRLLFTACVACLLLLAGGWDRFELSAGPGRVTRSFFGVYSIRPIGEEAVRLVHGTTLHGVQNRGSPERERMPTTYYAPGSGVGLALAAAPRLFGPAARIGVVGLGAGTLACYARPGQHWTFFEIDPAVVRIAEDPARFTFLKRCLPGAPVVVGDARLSLARAAPGSLDLLVIDAFSSDAIPTHLLTKEAFAVYRRVVGNRGLLLVHISNRYFELKPVVAAAAVSGGWHARGRSFNPTLRQRAANESGSMWVALSPSAGTMRGLVGGDPSQWKPIAERPGFAGWSDDHSSVLPLVRWR